MKSTANTLPHEPWNKGEIVGQRAPFKMQGHLSTPGPSSNGEPRARARRRAMGAATILKPLLIVGMGIVVVLIMLAVLLPII